MTSDPKKGTGGVDGSQQADQEEDSVTPDRSADKPLRDISQLPSASSDMHRKK